MGLRVAVANGNWSNTATWNGGVLPTVGDIVASNNFTVTIDQNINVDTLTNAAQAIVDAVPLMTSNTTPSGIADSNTGVAWHAFDRSGFTDWIGGNVNPGIWVSYEFTSSKAINQYYFGGYSTQNNWSFEAWNGSSWIALHTVTGASVTGTYTSPLLGNSTPYIKYRFVLNDTGFRRIYSVGMYEYLSTSPAVAGGTFNMGGGVNVTCTGSIPGGATTVLTWNGGTGTTSSITAANIFGASVANINNVVLNGTGTLNINATIAGAETNTGSRTLTVTNNGVINLVGNIENGPPTIAIVILISSNCIFNITGRIINPRANGLSMLTITAICTVNITGDVINNVTQASNNTININAAATVYITGSVRTITTTNTAYAISTGQAGFLSIVGSIEAGIASPALLSSNASAINLLSGPFVCSSYGYVPFYVTRMNYIKTLGSYFEFRNSSTNGALPPGAVAPPIRMSSPEVVSDLPSVSNVRFGVVYGVGSFTGTMRVPAAINVRLGVDVDNTVGTGAITAADVWNVLTSGLNTSGSIGDRLKNTSTVDSTGNQLAALI